MHSLNIWRTINKFKLLTQISHLMNLIALKSYMMTSYLQTDLTSIHSIWLVTHLLAGHQMSLGHSLQVLHSLITAHHSWLRRQSRQLFLKQALLMVVWVTITSMAIWKIQSLLMEKLTCMLDGEQIHILLHSM